MVKNIFALRIMCTNKKSYKENALSGSNQLQKSFRCFCILYVYVNIKTLRNNFVSYKINVTNLKFIYSELLNS